MDALSLCSGGGGLDIGIKLAVPSARTICYVEHEAYACDWLVRSMEAGILDAAPVWSDVASFDCTDWKPDAIIGGYPCQPFSYAGFQLGQSDSRHIWSHFARIIEETKPSILFFENVQNHCNIGLREVLLSISRLGFRVTAGLFESPGYQRRRRLYILAITESEGFQGCPQQKGAFGMGQAERLGLIRPPLFPPSPEEDWSEMPRCLYPTTESNLCMLPNGLAYEQSVRLLGNGVVPIQAAYAFLSLWSCLR